VTKKNEKKLADYTIGEFFGLRLRDLKDPSAWACCILPSLVVLIIVAGLLYKFVRWAFF